MLHRNSQKRIIFEDACYFVTSKTYGNHPYFREKIFCDLFVENLRVCKKMKGFLLYGWVLNFDHFHLLVQPSDKYDISKVMQFLKRNCARDINYIIGINKYDIRISEGANHNSRLQGGLFEYLCPVINSHDKKLIKYRQKFQQQYPDEHPFPKFQWQKSYFDHYIRNESDYAYHMDYIQYNPDKHGLPDNWPHVFTNPEYGDLIDE